MDQIKIGTCIPGTKAEEWLPAMIKAGFETVSLNFHMSLENTDLSDPQHYSVLKPLRHLQVHWRISR